jgi:hypothetical protein
MEELLTTIRSLKVLLEVKAKQEGRKRKEGREEILTPIGGTTEKSIEGRRRTYFASSRGLLTPRFSVSSNNSS